MRKPEFRENEHNHDDQVAEEGENDDGPSNCFERIVAKNVLTGVQRVGGRAAVHRCEAEFATIRNRWYVGTPGLVFLYVLSYGKIFKMEYTDEIFMWYRYLAKLAVHAISMINAIVLTYTPSTSRDAFKFSF